MANERKNWRMRYEHVIVRDVPIERPLVVPAERRVNVVHPEDILEGVLPADTGEPYATARPDFARGQEADPARIERFVENRFSRGLDRDPLLHAQVHQGDFATGLAALPRHPEVELRGALRARPAAERPPQSERGAPRLVAETRTSARATPYSCRLP